MDKKHIQSFVESMAFVNYSIVGNSQPAPHSYIWIEEIRPLKARRAARRKLQ